MISQPEAPVNAVRPDRTHFDGRAGLGEHQSATESARPLGEELQDPQLADLDRQLEAHEAEAMGREDDPRHAPSVIQDDVWTDVSPSDAEHGAEPNEAAAHHDQPEAADGDRGVEPAAWLS